MRHRNSGLAWSSASVGTGFVEYADAQKDMQSVSMYEHGFTCTSCLSPDVDLEPVTEHIWGHTLIKESAMFFSQWSWVLKEE